MTKVNKQFSWGAMLVMLLVGLFLFGASANAASTQVIQVQGEFNGTLEGYGADQESQSHTIQVGGELEFRGEDAQDVVITLRSGPETVLVQSTVEALVEGGQNVTLDQTSRARSVVLRTDEVPARTTIQIEFQTVFVGGSSADEINAGQIETEYATEGGTEESETFDVPVNASSSADNRIGRLQSEVDSLSDWRLYGIAGAAFGIVMLLVTIVVLYRTYSGKGDGENGKPPGSEPEDNGGPPV